MLPPQSLGLFDAAIQHKKDLVLVVVVRRDLVAMLVVDVLAFVLGVVRNMVFDKLPRDQKTVNKRSGTLNDYSKRGSNIGQQKTSQNYYSMNYK